MTVDWLFQEAVILPSFHSVEKSYTLMIKIVKKILRLNYLNWNVFQPCG